MLGVRLIQQAAAVEIDVKDVVPVYVSLMLIVIWFNLPTQQPILDASQGKVGLLC